MSSSLSFPAHLHHLILFHLLNSLDKLHIRRPLPSLYLLSLPLAPAPLVLTIINDNSTLPTSLPRPDHLRKRSKCPVESSLRSSLSSDEAGQDLLGVEQQRRIVGADLLEDEGCLGEEAGGSLGGEVLSVLEVLVFLAEGEDFVAEEVVELEVGVVDGAEGGGLHFWKRISRKQGILGMFFVDPELENE
ncbi:hypothetical protein B0T11DRAFT_99851 [Plectosphaerella cucumerina]|uniref:Uncharacterized protein n=1 Tax=Plectosphaerella cucumerina TaxID=40658 RepID=A0A8K0TCK0_9PEZI|nr:hypothetical protein B0T11DRAFT_99851 [Plectosphaerella cucumerina]